MFFVASDSRYDKMQYRYSGKSGLRLPAVSLGLWQNFGDGETLDNARAMIHRAFDLGITHFDLADNYGPPPGSAELNFGKILAQDLAAYRDELIISSKAGYLMWAGPYGEWGSRKHLIAGLNQSLKRMGLDYVDIFYSHRPDPNTPLEETMMALDQIVRQGKALYVGISNYPADRTREAARILRELGTPCLIHQPSYSIFNRWVEGGLLDALADTNMGGIVFSPLAQGMLSQKYLGGVPDGSRVTKPYGSLQKNQLSEERLAQIRKLNDLAQARGQSLAQMAIAWVLRHPVITSALIGASSIEQINENVAALDNLQFTPEELQTIDTIAGFK